MLIHILNHLYFPPLHDMYTYILNPLSPTTFNIVIAYANSNQPMMGQAIEPSQQSTHPNNVAARVHIPTGRGKAQGVDNDLDAGNILLSLATGEASEESQELVGGIKRKATDDLQAKSTTALKRLERQERYGTSHAHTICKFEGCTNQTVNNNVCIKHGAKVKLCSVGKSTLFEFI